MHRREFLKALFASGSFPLLASAAEKAAPRNIRITGVQVIVTNPGQTPLGNFVLVKLTTNQPGLYGWGDATCTGSELAIAKLIEEHLAPALIGADPLRTENLWQTLFFLPYYRSGSVHMPAISGIDMALWDIKGKVADLPVYEMLGGKTRDKLLTYRSIGGRDNKEVEDGVRKLMAEGYKVIKVQVAAPGLDAGYAVPSTAKQKAADEKAYAQGVPPYQLWDPAAYSRAIPKLFEHLRKTVGDNVELLHDVHERVTPSQALQMCKDVEPYKNA